MNSGTSRMISGNPPEAKWDKDGDSGLFDSERPDESDDTVTSRADLLTRTEALPGLDRPMPISDICESQLSCWIEAIAERDEQALTALYDATMSRVYGFVLRVVRQPALAEEVVEETFFQVWRQAARFDAGRGRALCWLLGMARSRAIDALRHEARFRHDPLADDSVHDVPDHSPAADELLDAARGHANLHGALMLLSAQPRQLVALAFFKGLTHEEIAGQTKLSLGTVKTQIRRSLIALRQALGDGASSALTS